MSLKDSEQSKITYQGMGLSGLLFIVFLILKLTNVIDWSWWWVTSPLWISALLVFAILFIVLIIVILLKNYIK